MRISDWSSDVCSSDLYRAEIRLRSDALHVAPNLEWVPDGPFADYRNQVSTPGYALIGSTGGAPIADGLGAFVHVRNLTGPKPLGRISGAIAVTPPRRLSFPGARPAGLAASGGRAPGRGT